MQTRRLHQVAADAKVSRRDEATSDACIWVVDLGGGELRFVQGDVALKELVERAGLPETARVYRLSAVSKTLGEIAALDSAFEGDPPAEPAVPELEAPAGAEAASAANDVAAPPARPVVAAPAEAPVVAAPAPAPVVAAPAPAPVVAAPAPTPVVAAPPPASPPPIPIDADLALLDRPLDDDDEYFEDARPRWPRLATGAALVALVIGGSYRLVRSRHPELQPVASTPTREPTAEAPPPPPAREPVVVAPPAPSPPAPSPPAPSPAIAAAPAPRPTPALPDPPLAGPPAAKHELPAPRAAADSYEQLVAQGKRLFNAGRSRKAEGLFEQALADKPYGTAALVGLAYVHLDRGKMQQANALFKQAIARDENYAPAVFGLAETNRQQGNRGAALAGFKQFLKLKSSGGDAEIARRLVHELGTGG
jgi:hypothetical protein